MSKKHNLFQVQGLSVNPIAWQFLGVFTSRKNAKKAIASAVGHKVKWHTPRSVFGVLETQGVIGFSVISIQPISVNTDYALRFQINLAMDDAMKAEENSNHLDDFLNSITGHN